MEKVELDMRKNNAVAAVAAAVAQSRETRRVGVTSFDLFVVRTWFKECVV